MNILVLNCGSSSLKFQLLKARIEDIPKDAEEVLARGSIERIGSQCLLSFEKCGGKVLKEVLPLRDHKQAIDYLLKWLIRADTAISGVRSLADIDGVGHRVVHGVRDSKNLLG